MAKAAGVSHAILGRIWRTFRLQPHRMERFKISPDLQLVEKIREVVGLEERHEFDTGVGRCRIATTSPVCVLGAG